MGLWILIGCASGLIAVVGFYLFELTTRRQKSRRFQFPSLDSFRVTSDK
jgi:hypothetical protein